jgi:type I restriction enzyme, S subunit
LIFNRSSLVKSGIGWSYLVTDENKLSTFDCHLIRVKVDTTKILPDYAYIYSLSPWARKYFLCVGQTTTMTTISQGDLEGLLIPVPPIDKQKSIVDAFIKIYQHQRKIITVKSKVMELASIHVSEQLST